MTESTTHKATKLTEKAMLVTITLGCPSFRKHDKIASNKIAEVYDLANGDDAGRYNKILISKDAIGKVQKLFTRARAEHYRLTLPWDDTNQRIILNSLFIEYSTGIRKIFAEIEKVLQHEFLPAYPSLVEEAETRLGPVLFNADEYPAPDEVAEKFKYKFSVKPIPESGDFRVQMQSDEADRIRKEIEASNDEALNNAMRDVCRRMLEVTRKMAGVLSDEKRKYTRKNGTTKIKEAEFRDSLINNVCELMQLVPKLNITDDEELEALRKSVEEKLCKYEPKTIRENIETRREVAKEADALASKMAAYMGTFK